MQLDTRHSSSPDSSDVEFSRRNMERIRPYVLPSIPKIRAPSGNAAKDYTRAVKRRKKDQDEIKQHKIEKFYPSAKKGGM